ncbi:TolC family protein [Aquabacterium sp. OR-4]|uniref:TolC family protein n=1 Tax=Aquabacterium sp. OR-4 TaxID=2978127 RepID=UPI0021B18897|nr:TolC family protein [Aquabacterium sp. OR-4]MDT7838493.1 TolC family protein [Aquabacterium sp. OR-4]
MFCHPLPLTAPGRRHCAAAWALAAAALLALALEPAGAQTTVGPPAASAAAAAAPAASALPLTLRQAFDQAWARQPEAQALAHWREAASAQARAARAWTPEPVALAVAGSSDRFTGQQGARELELGLAVPLWRRGEQGRSQALAEAEAQAHESRSQAAQLRLAAALREAWWAWQRSGLERSAARAQHGALQRLAADVARRHRAGALARADQHQADGALAAAEAALAQAEAAQQEAALHLAALAGVALPELDRAGAAPAALPEPEPEPEPQSAPALPAAPARAPDALVPSPGHAELRALNDRRQLAGATLALLATQGRASPELTVATRHERPGHGLPYQQSLSIGVRLPLQADPQQAGRLAAARAEAQALQAQLALDAARLAAEQAAARVRTTGAQAQLAAAERRARLAAETRGFIDQAFQLGEADLPTRLRVEAEAAEAGLQAQRARIDLAAAVSAWRQALGLLPP